MASQGAWDDGDFDFEAARAGLYGLLSRLLLLPPKADFLNELKAIGDSGEGDDSPLGQALRALAKAAARDPEELEDEYTRLFYGQGQGGELLPYASYYLTGSLHDRPLAALRGDMARLGIARGDVNDEPEDHIAILCEIMHGLIVGTFGAGAVGLAEQTSFFEAHLAPWAMGFFEDLEAADSADFYVAVAKLGQAFLAVEHDAFQMAA